MWHFWTLNLCISLSVLFTTCITTCHDAELNKDVCVDGVDATCCRGSAWWFPRGSGFFWQLIRHAESRSRRGENVQGPQAKRSRISVHSAAWAVEFFMHRCLLFIPREHQQMWTTATFPPVFPKTSAIGCWCLALVVCPCPPLYLQKKTRTTKDVRSLD